MAPTPPTQASASPPPHPSLSTSIILQLLAPPVLPPSTPCLLPPYPKPIPILTPKGVRAMSLRHWESIFSSISRGKTYSLSIQGGSPQRRWNWVCKCPFYQLWGPKVSKGVATTFWESVQDLITGQSISGTTDVGWVNVYFGNSILRGGKGHDP
jgi:hypothetical protein